MKPIYVTIVTVLFCLCLGRPDAFCADDDVDYDDVPVNNPEIVFVARTPSPSPNVIARAGDYIYHGDGSVIAVYYDEPDLTLEDRLTELTLAGRFEVQIGLDPDPDWRAGTQGITGLFYDDAEQYLYVTCGNEGLQIYDVGDNATAPPLLGYWLVDAHEYDDARARAKDVFIEHRSEDENYAYIVYKLYTGQEDGHRTGIQIVDISDPANPSFVGECGTPGAFALGLAGLVEREQAIYVHYDADRGHQAYVTDYSNGLAVYDVDDPVHPTHEAWSAIIYALDVTVAPDASGDYYAWVTAGGFGLWAIPLPADDDETGDVLYPTSQCQYKILSYVDEDDVLQTVSYTLTTSIEIFGNYAYLSDQLLGLVVVDISDPEAINTGGEGEYPDLTGLVTAYSPDMSGAYSVYVDGSGADPVIYTTNYINGLQKITINDGDQNNAAAWQVAGVDASNHTPTPSDVDAFVLDQDGDVSYNKSYVYTVDDDPTDINGNQEGFTVHFVSLATDWINFYYKGFLPTDGEARDVCVGDTYIAGKGEPYFYAYVADGSAGLKVIDPGLPDLDADGGMIIEAPADPQLVGSCSVGAGSAAKVCVRENYAYVAAEAGGLRIINVANPSSPGEVGHLDDTDGIPDARSVDVAGNYAYVAGGWNGLHVVNASAPAAPFLVSTCSLPGIAVDVSIADDRAYVACQYSGEGVTVWDAGSDTWQSFSPVIPIDVDAIAVDGNVAWIGTNGQGIKLFDITNQAWLRSYTSDDGGLAADAVGAIAIDSSNKVWCGTAGSGVSVFDTAASTWTTYTIEDDTVTIYDEANDTYETVDVPENIDICGDDIEVIAIDTSGTDDIVWIGTQGDGVSMVDTATMAWTTCTTTGTPTHTTEGLINNEIEGIAIDSAGNAWIASDGQYREVDANEDGTADGVQYDDGEGGDTRGGITKINLNGNPADPALWTWTTYYPGDELPGPHNDKNAYNEIEAVAIDAYNRVWIGSEGYYWDTGDTDDDEIRLAGGGVTLFDPGTGVWQNSEDWAGYPTDNEYQDRVVAIAADKGDDIMWFGTYGGGVIKCDMNDSPAIPANWIWTTYTVGEDGVLDDLPDNYIQSITVDGGGNAWFGFFPGAGGLYEIDISDPENVEWNSTDDGYYNSGYYESIYGVYAAVSDENPEVDFMWVADGDQGIGFFANPGTVSITNLKVYDTPGFVKQVEAFGSFAVIADGAGGIQIAGVNPVEEGDDSWMDTVPTDFSRHGSAAGCFVGSVSSESFLQAVADVAGFIRDKLF